MKFMEFDDMEFINYKTKKPFEVKSFFSKPVQKRYQITIGSIFLLFIKV
jgi:hypothetical protein